MKRFLLFLVTAVIIVPFVLHGESDITQTGGHFFSEIPPRASVFGKYSGLKQRFFCPEALYKMSYLNNLRNFHDLGFNKKEKSWCGTTLQTGYVVYYGSMWYVWSKQEIKNHPDEFLATMNGTYSGLIKKKRCQYMKTRGNFIEFGYVSSPMCGHPRRPETGFFVYVRPYVYIYRNRDILLKHVPEEVSCNGRYSTLVNVVRCDIQGEQKYQGQKMKESGVVLEFDEEEQRSRLWPQQCGESLGPGHYVYKYPYWYVWKDKRNPDDEPAPQWPPRE